MKKGVLLFAHNSREIDYARMSIISGSLAKHYLGLPVSLVTDASTISWMQTSDCYDKAIDVFDKIIEADTVEYSNYRRLHDGPMPSLVPFINFDRSMAYDYTPYEQTLLIDTDFLIFSNRLNEFWDSSDTVLISSAMQDICDKSRAGYQDRYVSDTGVHLYWATTVMFTKNEYSKIFFDLVKHIKENYNIYSDLYSFFNVTQYRNDIAFSIAKHILDGFSTDTSSTLPPIVTTIDKDILYEVKKDLLVFLITPKNDSAYVLASSKGVDIHVMNKQSIIRNYDKLMESL